MVQDASLLQTTFLIEDIPSIIWGEPSNKVWIAVHGNLSNKQDTVIRLLAGQVLRAGCQVLSFDLPDHGERAGDGFCSITQSMSDLHTVLDYAKQRYRDISLFGCSIGAYFSLLAYAGIPFQKALFLSPVIDMHHILRSMMRSFGVSEQRLAQERRIFLPGAPALDWEYYRYVQEHPLTCWDVSTAILCGANDELCACNTTGAFAKRFGCSIDILPDCKHFFHTPKQLSSFDEWLALHI